MSEPFIAEVRAFGFNFAPRGWAFCNGQLLPIAQNTALFSLVGTIYGGDGRTTFALPDLRGRSPMHPGRGPGLTSRRLGEQVGAATVSLTEAQIPSHTHDLIATSTGATDERPANRNFAATEEPLYNSNPDSEAAAATIGSAGQGAAHNNRQPYLAINFCIALIGLFPSRS